MRDPQGNKSRGYGFVAFRDMADATQAMRMMTGVWLGSRAIRCNWANQKSNQATGGTGASKSSGGRSSDFESVLNQTPLSNTTIYIGNLSPETTERQIRDVFEEYGRIEEVRIQGDKGYAFARYGTHQTAATAILNGTGKIIGMRTIRCSWGKEKSQDSNNSGSSGYNSSMPMMPMMPNPYGGGYPMMNYGPPQGNNYAQGNYGNYGGGGYGNYGGDLTK